MHASIAELRRQGLSAAAITYELGSAPRELARMIPTEAQQALIEDLLIGHGRWEVGPESGRAPFRVRVAYLSGGAMLVNWIVPNAAAWRALDADIPHRLGTLGTTADADVEFRVGKSCSGARTFKQWKAASRLKDGLVNEILDAVAPTTSDRAKVMVRARLGAYVNPRLR